MGDVISKQLRLHGASKSQWRVILLGATSDMDVRIDLCIYYTVERSYVKVQELTSSEKSRWPDLALGLAGTPRDFALHGKLIHILNIVTLAMVRMSPLFDRREFTWRRNKTQTDHCQCNDTEPAHSKSTSAALGCGREIIHCIKGCYTCRRVVDPS